eukprot:5206800-Prorocentrum_lima.AAC.1
MVKGSTLVNGDNTSALSTDKLHDTNHQSHRSMELKHGISVLFAVNGLQHYLLHVPGSGVYIAG